MPRLKVNQISKRGAWRPVSVIFLYKLSDVIHGSWYGLVFTAIVIILLIGWVTVDLDNGILRKHDSIYKYQYSYNICFQHRFAKLLFTVHMYFLKTNYLHGVLSYWLTWIKKTYSKIWSRNKQRNLWGKRCLSSWWPLIWFGFWHDMCIYI